MFEHKLIVNLHTPYRRFLYYMHSILISILNIRILLFSHISPIEQKIYKFDKHRNARRYKKKLIGWLEAQNIKTINYIKIFT